MTSVLDPKLTTATPRFEAVAGVQAVEIKDGLVIYQHEPERVHRLNRSAAVIYLLCDGSLTFDEIAHEVQHAFGTAKDLSSAAAHCLRQLMEAELVRSIETDSDQTPGPISVQEKASHE
jgi:hypothetical protein